jgi:hypothetical protein
MSDMKPLNWTTEKLARHVIVVPKHYTSHMIGKYWRNMADCAT